MQNGTTKTKLTVKDMIVLICVGISAGAMFSLPYLKDTFYVPLMNGLGITDTQMGGLLSMYAIAFLPIGIPCGYLADRFRTKYMLMAIVLLTALGAAWYFFLPNYVSCLIIFVVWSFTTTMYWPIMNKVSTEMGEKRVKAYGYIESVRAAAYVACGSIALAVFTAFGGERIGIQAVIAFYAIMLGIITVLIALMMDKGEATPKDQIPSIGQSFRQCFSLIKNRTIWVLGMIIFCILCAYACTGMLVPYFERCYGWSSEQAATFGFLRYAILPTIAGVTGGIFSGKLGSVSKLFLCAFVGIIVGGIVLIAFPVQPSVVMIVVAISAIICFACVTNKTMYMAPMSESDIPKEQVGMASSLLSMIGFSCELYIYIWLGNTVERYAGDKGYKIVFIAMIFYALVGLLLTVYFRKSCVSKHEKKA